MQLTLKVKKLNPAAVLPAKANESDAGYDIVAIDDGAWSDDGTYLQYRTGLSIEVPPGYHTELFPRSSVSKTDLVLANSIGLVDNGYRGELLVRFKYIPRFQLIWNLVVSAAAAVLKGKAPKMEPLTFHKGDKIAQIVVRRTYDAVVSEVTELSSTARGAGGFGSTGK